MFFIVFFDVYQGVREVSPSAPANARMPGATPRQLLRHVYLSSATSWVFSSLHTSAGLAFVGALAGVIGRRLMKWQPRQGETGRLQGWRENACRPRGSRQTRASR